MGATVTCGKLVSGFKRSDGSVVYTLFEQMYEKNCYPHSPRWSATAMGSYAEVMKFVFSGAACCEGGMLQTTRGQTAPETYLEGWKRAFNQPVDLPDRTIRLKISDAWSAALVRGEWPQVKAILHKLGRDDLATELDEGREVELSLHSDAEALGAIYGINSPFSPWRILQRTDTSTNVNKDLVPEPVIGKVKMPSYRLYMLSAKEHELIQSVDGGPWQVVGWAYSAVADFVRHVAYPAEMACTGSAKAMIAAYRALTKGTPLAPKDTLLTVTISPEGVEKWKIDAARRLAVALGHAEEGGPCPESFMVSLEEMEASDPERDKHVVYHAAHLDAKQATWRVPEAVELEVSNLPVETHIELVNSAEQMQLI
jgi:hypothetical protein